MKINGLDIVKKVNAAIPFVHLGLGGYLGIRGAFSSTKMLKQAQKANNRMIELLEKNGVKEIKDLTDEEKEEFESCKYVFLSSVGLALWGGVETITGLGFMHVGLTELCSNVNEQNQNVINDKLDTILNIQNISFHNNLRTASDVIALCNKNGITEEDLKSCFETWKNEDPESKESDAE